MAARGECAMIYMWNACASTPTRRNWPLSSATPPLAALPTVPALARLFARATLHTWHEDSLVQDAELIVSELTGNAVAASSDTDGRPVYVDGRMPVIRVYLLTDGVRLLIKVFDQAPGIPVLREATEDEESGRGLILVNAIADKWGWKPAKGQPGKVVWAQMSLLEDRVGVATVPVRNEPDNGILARVRDALRCL
jgi:anti-sigma regulatory factor (Ser/Thr protein kinase)